MIKFITYPILAGFFALSAHGEEPVVLLDRSTTMQSVLSIADVIRDANNLYGRRVAVRGYLTYEPENRYLWTKAEKYDAQEEPSIAIKATDALYNRREMFNRREVVVSGTVRKPPCNAPVGCISVGLSDLSIVKFVRPLSKLDPVPVGYGDASFAINERTRSAGELRHFADRLADIVRHGSSNHSVRAQLTSLIPSRERLVFSQGLAQRDSRVNWLLFDGDYALAYWLKTRPSLRLDIVRTERLGAKINPPSYLCFCTVVDCNPRSLTSLRVYFRAAADPYFCIPVSMDEDGWHLDAGFLLGAPEEDRLLNEAR